MEGSDNIIMQPPLRPSDNLNPDQEYYEDDYEEEEQFARDF